MRLTTQPVPALRNKGLLVVDIGDHRLKAVWLKTFDRSRAAVSAQTRTQGFEEGRIVDMARFVGALRRLRAEIESKGQTKPPNRVIVGLNTRSVNVQESHAIIPLTERRPRAVTPSDVDQVRRQAMLLGCDPQNLVIWDAPVSYRLDETDGIQDPIGLFGRKLEIRALLWTMSFSSALNLDEALRQAGWKCMGRGLNPVGVYWALGRQQRVPYLGLVDLGASGCGLYTFHNGRVIDASHCPFGIKTITLELSRRLTVEEPVAEQLKITYASVYPDGSTAHEILLHRPQGGFTAIQQQTLRACADPWIEDVMRWIRSVRRNIPRWDRLVVCGGGALLDGLAERLERSLGIPVELARPQHNLGGVNGAHDGMIFLAAWGLAQMKRGESASQTLTKGGWMKRVLDTAKRLYEEYF